MNDTQDLNNLITEIRQSWDTLRGLPPQLSTLQTEVQSLRRAALVPRHSPQAPRPGCVSDDCARHLASQFVVLCDRRGLLEALSEVPVVRDELIKTARETLGITKAALTTTEVPLPSQFSSELVGLISQFGVARKHMMPFPIGRGTSRPARFGTRPAFGALALSAAIPDKAPSITYASLESHKVGGLVRLPREIDEQSMVPMGQFLARYGATEFARAEDTFAFLADGTNTYEAISGIVQVATDAGHTVELAAGKTKPSDITAADLRLLRTTVNKAALSGSRSAYFLDSTFDAFLPTLNTDADPTFYVRYPDGSARLDGYPVVWTDVLQPYQTTAAAGKPCAVFGTLGAWWFGVHGHPRIDTNDAVLFVNDQLAVRFIEEIDFDYAAEDACSALLTAAA